ncbi:hypothetical protein DHEL01_v210733 [Diaporthe helianthi]|uniref:DUF985 domain-containing protein n=1 Tax=Diaporthe helianthi TaxID=158607 RepID=A0A2P5HKT9_DIAHE|nr:hypothetical protein DHEL01_v210733 [Diaporthe helianthi]
MTPLPYSLLLAVLLSSAKIPHVALSSPGPRTQRGSSSSSSSGGGRQTPISERSAEEIIEELGLIPNEEKGYYAQTFEDPYTVTCLNRSASTAIYYLIEGSDGDSIWHRVDAVEIWHYYAGAPLVLSLSFDNGQPLREQTLGPDIFNDQQPQVVIQKSEWQSARSLGEWTLVGTTVAPGFVLGGVELADPGWTPDMT